MSARLFATDIGISFTGVAGPDELEGKPVGTVYIGIAIKGSQTIVEKTYPWWYERSKSELDP